MKAYCKKHDLLKKGDRICAAVSGGADSMALLALLCELQKDYALSISVLHIHHGIRGASADADAAFVEAFCKRRKIPCEILYADAPSYAKNMRVSLEEAGHLLRAEFYRSRITEGLADKVATAHQMEDVAETMLFHLCRGTGLAGLSSLSAKRGSIIRPLLCLHRKEIEAYLRSKRLRFRTDETNAGDDYTRNKLRHHIFPYLEKEINPSSVDHFFALAERLSAPEAKRNESEAVRQAVRDLTGTTKDLTASHCDAVLSLFEKEEGKQADLPGGIIARKEGKGILLKRAEDTEEEAPGDEVFAVAVPGLTRCGRYTIRTEFAKVLPDPLPRNKWCKWVDYDKIVENLSFRRRRRGDILTIDQKGGRKSLSDYLTDKKIPKKERDRWYVLADAKEVILLPDGRLNERYKITKNTKRVLLIEITEEMV